MFKSVRTSWVAPSVVLDLTLQGVPGAQVDVLFFSARSDAADTVFVRDVRAGGTFDALGLLTLSVDVTPNEFLFGALRLQYISGDDLGEMGDALTLGWNRPDPPVTEPPATEPPATEPPLTEPAVTEPPAADPPAAEAPTTAQLATQLLAPLPLTSAALSADLSSGEPATVATHAEP